MRRVLYPLLFSILLPLVAYGQSSSGIYRIGPNDLLQVQVYELAELGGQFRVSEENVITLPLIGHIEVGGLTAREVQAQLKVLLESKYAQRATVTVEVREYRSKPITVIGAVHRPGPLSTSGKLRLLDVLTKAGGLNGNQGDWIYVLRQAENGLSDQVEIRVDDLLVRTDPKVNIPIFAKDLINVPPKVNVTIFFLGEVRTPGAHVFQSTERATLLAAIARAGGLGERAGRKILIKRQTLSAEERILVDYKRILSGKDPDPDLKDGDVVFVKQTFL